MSQKIHPLGSVLKTRAKNVGGGGGLGKALPCLFDPERINLVSGGERIP